ncbi:MAG TPA: hypothetical protein VG368_04915 [Acidimicrobiales bacterium]|jgi:hypothetical protein|nr:hypothetical protein [Acidimicrobiales bacterium]
MPLVRHWERVVIVAIVVSLPAIVSALDSKISAAAAIVRFVIAGVLVFLAEALVEHLWASYSSAARQRAIEETIARRRELAEQGRAAMAPTAVKIDDAGAEPA